MQSTLLLPHSQLIPQAREKKICRWKNIFKKMWMKRKGGEELLMDSSSTLRCDNLRTFFKKCLKSVFKPCFKQYQSARATSKNGYSQMLWKGEKRYSRRLKWQLLYPVAGDFERQCYEEVVTCSLLRQLTFIVRKSFYDSSSVYFCSICALLSVYLQI